MAEISEEKREEIKEEVKKILDNFSKALERVKFKEKKAGKEEKESSGFREEKEGKKGDEDFRRMMFENAPQKNEEFIIAEKKKW